MPYPEENSVVPLGFVLSFKDTSHNFSLIDESVKALFKAQFTHYNPLNRCWGQWRNESNTFSGQAAFEATLAMREACP
jgi:hypothetical protein